MDSKQGYEGALVGWMRSWVTSWIRRTGGYEGRLWDGFEPDGLELDGLEAKTVDGFELDGFEVGVLDGFEGDGFESDNDYLSQIESIIS